MSDGGKIQSGNNSRTRLSSIRNNPRGSFRNRSQQANGRLVSKQRRGSRQKGLIFLRLLPQLVFLPSLILTRCASYLSWQGRRRKRLRSAELAFTLSVIPVTLFAVHWVPLNIFTRAENL